MPELAVASLDSAAYTVPTDGPESDGTFAWDATTIVVVHAAASDGTTGLGYTYGPAPVAGVISGMLAGVVCGGDPLAPGAAYAGMRAALRNAGQAGMGALAVSAVDVALHDLRARLLGVPLSRALGMFHPAVPIYGSGGFTSYSLERLAEQLGGWVAEGIARVKMKVGREPAADGERLRAALEAIGDAELMVDANGAYDVATARSWAARFGEAGVTWLEEPVSSDDADGMRRVRDGAPPGLAIAAGEYAWSGRDIRRLLEAGAVDVAQADVTRCGGFTELVRIDGLCAAHGTPLSLHCAPGLSAHAGCALEQLVHLEYFHDHVRLESMLFDGVLSPAGGALRPDPSVPGHGLTLRTADAERFRAA